MLMSVAEELLNSKLHRWSWSCQYLKLREPSRCFYCSSCAVLLGSQVLQARSWTTTRVSLGSCSLKTRLCSAVVCLLPELKHWIMFHTQQAWASAPCLWTPRDSRRVQAGGRERKRSYFGQDLQQGQWVWWSFFLAKNEQRKKTWVSFTVKISQHFLSLEIYCEIE